MKTTTKNLSDTRVELTVTLDADDLSAAKEQAVEKLRGDLKIQGFRKGKVPREVALKHLDPNMLASETLDIAVRRTIPRAFGEADRQPLQIPEVTVKKFVPDQSAEYIATADVVPEVKLGNFKKLKVKKTSAEPTSKDVNEVLENIQKAYGEKQVVKRKAKLSDEVIIDFEGSKDGTVFPGGSAKDFPLTLGSQQFIPGFEEGIVGHESGDRFDLPLTFPKDYHNKDLAGKKVNFNVLVKQVNEIKKPKLDTDLAKKCGPFKSIDELKADIKKNLAAQNSARAEDKYKDDLVTALVNASKVSAPEILIHDQMNFIRSDIENNAKSRGLSFADYLTQTGQTEEEWEKEAHSIAEMRVKSSLVLQVLARDENITVSDNEVDAKIAELKDVYKKSKEALENLKKPEVRLEIKNRLTIEKALDFLVKANS